MVPVLRESGVGATTTCTCVPSSDMRTFLLTPKPLQEKSTTRSRFGIGAAARTHGKAEILHSDSLNPVLLSEGLSDFSEAFGAIVNEYLSVMKISPSAGISVQMFIHSKVRVYKRDLEGAVVHPINQGCVSLEKSPRD